MTGGVDGGREGDCWDEMDEEVTNGGDDEAEGNGSKDGILWSPESETGGRRSFSCFNVRGRHVSAGIALLGVSVSE